MADQDPTNEGPGDNFTDEMRIYQPPDDFTEEYDFNPEEDVYRAVTIDTAPAFDMGADLSLGGGLHGGMIANAQPKLPPIPSFDMMPAMQLPPLPAMPASSGAPVPKPDQPIPSLSKCPIKAYTTIKMDKAVDPKVVTAEVQRALEACKIECKMLQAGLKLRGSVGSDKGTESTPGYESMGSVSLVFQLFWSDGNEHLIGVFRRLCGDVIAFNDHYRQVMKLLQAPEAALASAIRA